MVSRNQKRKQESQRFSDLVCSLSRVGAKTTLLALALLVTSEIYAKYLFKIGTVKVSQTYELGSYGTRKEYYSKEHGGYRTDAKAQYYVFESQPRNESLYLGISKEFQWFTGNAYYGNSIRGLGIEDSWYYFIYGSDYLHIENRLDLEIKKTSLEIYCVIQCSYISQIKDKKTETKNFSGTEKFNMVTLNLGLKYDWTGYSVRAYSTGVVLYDGDQTVKEDITDWSGEAPNLKKLIIFRLEFGGYW